MSSFTPEYISGLCDKWRENAIFGDIFSLGPGCEQFELRRNGVEFEKLDFDCIVAALFGLNKIYLLPGLGQYMSADQVFLWAWCGELVLYPEKELFQERELRSLFKQCLNASQWMTIGAIPSPHDRGLLAKRVADGSDNLAYLCFPLLEGLLKKACNQFLGMDGSVVVDFEVPNKNAGHRRYKANGKGICSSLRDLLWLYRNEVADQGLKVKLDEFADFLETFDPGAHGFDIIYGWRNQSLHGNMQVSTIGGCLFNLILLICLYFRREHYIDLRDELVAAIEANPQGSLSGYFPVVPTIFEQA